MTLGFFADHTKTRCLSGRILQLVSDATGPFGLVEGYVTMWTTKYPFADIEFHHH